MCAFVHDVRPNPPPSNRIALSASGESDEMGGMEACRVYFYAT